MPYKYAAARAGIPERTFLDWMRKGRDGKAPYAAFYGAIKACEADAITANVAIIRKAANSGTWQAAAWLLERRNPEDFGSQRHEFAELKRQIKELEAMVRGSGPLPPAPPPGPAPESGPAPADHG